MAISSPGIGSGLDVNAIVTGLMGVEKRPLNAVTTQKTDYQAQLSAYGSLKSSLSAFQTTVSALNTASKFNAQTSTSSNTSVFTASANGVATPGDYAVTVSQLAQSQKLASAGFASVNDAVGSGSITISFGDYTPASINPAVGESFAANASKNNIVIPITGANNTLAGIRDAINATNASVSATIVNNGTSNQLVITSKDTGKINGMKISVSDDDGNNTDAAGLSQLAYDPLASGVKNLTQVQQEKNALLTVDGISIVKSSNVVSDVVSGVTLNLVSTSANSVNLNVASNVSTVKESVTAFVDAYNKLDATLRSLTKFDPNGKNSGVLLGDGTARSIINQIKSVMTKTISTGGALTSLSQIGVGFQREGQLGLDAKKLDAALATNFSDVASLFARSARATDPAITYADSTSRTKEGTYSINVTQLGSATVNTIGAINGVSATGNGIRLTGAFGDASEGLSINVTGGAVGARGSITFTKGYAAQLDTVMTNLLSSEGILTAKTDGINTSISRLDKQADAINLRLTAIEARYRAQFTKLDSTLSSMASTSTFLTQQLAAINANK